MKQRPRTNNNARYSEEYPASKVYDLMGEFPCTTTDIRIKLGGVSTGTAKNKLEALLSQGKVTRVRSGQIWLWQKVVGTQPMNSALMEVEG